MNKFLENSSCINSCSDGRYADDLRVCQSCSISCATCKFTADTCLSCSGGTFLFKNKCIGTCDFNYYTVNQSCLSCKQGCKSCTNSLDCSECQDKFELINTNCFCKDNKFFFNSECVSLCPTGFYADTLSRECKVCQGLCQTCITATFCTTCIDSSFTIQNGQCICSSDFI